MKIETWLDYIHPDDVEKISKAEQEALHIYHFSEKFRMYNPKKADWRWMRIIAVGGKENEKWNGYANGIVLDITKSHKVKVELMKSQEHLQSLLEGASGFAVYRMVFDENSPYSFKMAACSPSYEQITGIRPEQATVNDYYNSVHPEDYAAVSEAHNRAFTTGKFDMIARVYHPVKGCYVWLHAISTAVFDHKGKITHVNGLLIDVSEAQDIKEKLQQSLKSLNRKSEEQAELNAALNVLLDKRERDRLELEQGIVLNIKEMVSPYIQKLKASKLSNHQKALLDLVDSNLAEVTSQLVLKLSIPQFGLSPAEIKVANYIKQGKSSKEIASWLGLSPKTIKNQRVSIIKKLGITNKKTNLRSYLLATGPNLKIRVAGTMRFIPNERVRSLSAGCAGIQPIFNGYFTAFRAFILPLFFTFALIEGKTSTLKTLLRTLNQDHLG